MDTMDRLTNRRTFATLVGLAVVGFVLAGVLDHHGEWNDPRQAVANLAWVTFLVCALATVILGVRAAVVRRRHPAA
ncbi:MAG: hypothetical protein QOF60_96 [Actinomycetota bacterium]|jgi:hypothetical protein|nr:hypothetical protein [Actinomycetota bacterium]